MPGRTTTVLPSAVIFDQRCPKIGNPGANCSCKYKGQDIVHDRPRQAAPIPTADRKLVQCPFWRKDGEPCTRTCKQSAPSDMERHQSAVHTDYRAYVCSRCNKAFPQRSHRTVHMRQHTGEKETCPECDWECKDPSQMKRHMQACHPGVYRPQRRRRPQKSNGEQSTSSSSTSQSPPLAQQQEPTSEVGGWDPNSTAELDPALLNWINVPNQMGNFNFSLDPVPNSFGPDQIGVYNTAAVPAPAPYYPGQPTQPGDFSVPVANQYDVELPSQYVSLPEMELFGVSGSQLLPTQLLEEAASNWGAQSTSIPMQRQDSGIGMEGPGIAVNQNGFDFGEMVGLDAGKEMDWFANSQEFSEGGLSWSGAVGNQTVLDQNQEGMAGVGVDDFPFDPCLLQTS